MYIFTSVLSCNVEANATEGKVQQQNIAQPKKQETPGKTHMRSKV